MNKKKSKYANRNTKPTATTSAEEAVETTPIEAEHKKFRDAMKDTVTPEPKQANEPILETSAFEQEPYETPTIEREYTGYQQSANQQPTDTTVTDTTETTPPKAESKTPPTDTTSSSASNFEPTPPPPADDDDMAPEQDMNGGEDFDTFKIPEGSAEDLVDFGATSINFLIKNFASLAVCIKIKPAYYGLKDNRDSAIDIINEFNESCKQELQLDQEDISMLKKPLVRLMQEKGIKGLTASEQLGIAMVLILAKKAKQFIELRKSAKKLESRIDNLAISLNKTTVKSEPEPELVDVEEV